MLKYRCNFLCTHSFEIFTENKQSHAFSISHHYESDFIKDFWSTDETKNVLRHLCLNGRSENSKTTFNLFWWKAQIHIFQGSFSRLTWVTFHEVMFHKHKKLSFINFLEITRANLNLSVGKMQLCHSHRYVSAAISMTQYWPFQISLVHPIGSDNTFL